MYLIPDVLPAHYYHVTQPDSKVIDPEQSANTKNSRSKMP